jgi:hypothetical protein
MSPAGRRVKVAAFVCPEKREDAERLINSCRVLFAFASFLNFTRLGTSDRLSEAFWGLHLRHN